MPDNVLIRFKVQYDASLLDNQTLEHGPVLMFWSSMEGRKKHYKSLSFPSNGASFLSNWTDVELVLPAIPGRTFDARSNTFYVRPDDTIGVQAKVTTPNEEGESTFQSVGDALLPFAVELARSDSKDLADWEHSLDLTFSMYFDKKGQRVKKGAVTLKQFSAVLESTNRPVAVAVNPKLKIDEFSYVAENEPLFSSVVRDIMVRSITMFTQEAAEKCTAFLPASEEVKRVHAPFYHLPAGLALGPDFVLAPHATKIDDPVRLERVEKWMRKILGYSLVRENFSEGTFITTIDKQHARTDNTYDDTYTQCAAIVAQGLAIPPTSMPYISDFVRTGKRSKLAADKNGFVAFSNKHLHSVERFSEMAQNDGGDCEDGGNFAMRIGVVLQQNDWKDPLVRAASALLKNYVVSLNLGSVRSAALGNDKHSKAHSDISVIDTKEDRSVNYGAHMWCESLPLAKMVTLVQRSVPDLDPNVMWLPGASRAPWVAAVPHLVIEATGRLNPLLLPAAEYVVTGGDAAKQATLTRLKAEAAVDAFLDANTVTFKQMKVVKQPDMLELERDKRLTTFYRDTTHTFTAAFMEMGLTNIDWIWANRGKRISAHEAWTNTEKFKLAPISTQMRAPESAALAPAASSEQPAATSYPKNSLVPCTTLSELNKVTQMIGNRTPSPNTAPVFHYGVPIEDKVQCPVLPATALVPGPQKSNREIAVVATLLRHSPPIDAPGDWEQIEEMHEARIAALANEGIDELAREKFEDAQFKKLVDGVRAVMNKPEGEEWPAKASRKWTMMKKFFSARMFNAEQGDKVPTIIVADVKKMVDAGVIVYARVHLEEPMPHRRTVLMQFLCNAAKAV